MQGDEFEKKIQNKMQDLQLDPDSEVWQRVALKIEKEKKKRRIFFFWIFPGFLLIAGTVALLVINTTKPKNIVNEVSNYNVTKPNLHSEKINSPLLSRTKSGVNNKEKNTLKRSKASIPQAEMSYTKKSGSSIQKLPVIAGEAIKEMSSKIEKTNIYNNKNASAKPLLMHRFYNPFLIIKNDSASKNSVAGKLNFKNDTADKKEAKQTAQAKEQSAKKWQLGFTAYSGISNNLSSLLKFSGSYANYSSSLNTPSNTPSNTSSNTPSNTPSAYSSNKFTTGFSYGLGVFVKKQVTKRISLSLGADFHSYNVKLKVGNKVNTQTRIVDPFSLSSFTTDFYYSPGSSVTYSNKYQQIEFPVNVGFRINNNQQKPLLVSAGLSAGYLFSTNALYGNSSANIFYVDKQKFHHFLYSAQAGLLLPVSASKSYLFSAGPVVQYGFSNAAKAASGTNQHLFFTGIKATVTFK